MPTSFIRRIAGTVLIQIAMKELVPLLVCNSELTHWKESRSLLTKTTQLFWQCPVAKIKVRIAKMATGLSIKS